VLKRYAPVSPVQRRRYVLSIVASLRSIFLFVLPSTGS